MKKYFINISLLLAIFVFQQCSLNEEPKTFISPDTFFSSPDSYNAAVMGIYTDVHNLWASNCMMMKEMFSDICGEPSASFEQAYPTYTNATEPFYYNTRDMWSRCYSIIKNANFILSKMPEDQKALIGEAKFLRAFAYFHLVQFYGDIPLRITPVESYADVQIPKSKQEDVYALIVEDLKYAEINLNEKAPQQGRVYQLAATALLAKIYLTMAGNPLNQTALYSNAVQNAVKVISSGQFALMDDYSSIFHNTVYTSESVWEKLFIPANGGNGLHNLTSTADSYRPIMVPATWFINSFPQGDTRREWGIQQTYQDPNGRTLAPFFQKFINNSFTDDNIGSSGSGLLNYTIPYLRLAEMYLIAAEAENEQNGPANAYQYINKIRWRARVDKDNSDQVPDLDGLTKEQFRDAVLMERKWELHLEGSTWFDLKRTNTFNRIQEIRGDALVHPIGNYNQTWPIPDTEITNNNIDQNPLYK